MRDREKKTVDKTRFSDHKTHGTYLYTTIYGSSMVTDLRTSKQPNNNLVRQCRGYHHDVTNSSCMFNGVVAVAFAIRRRGDLFRQICFIVNTSLLSICLCVYACMCVWVCVCVYVCKCLLRFAYSYVFGYLKFWKKITNIKSSICNRMARIRFLSHPSPWPSFSRSNFCNLFDVRMSRKWWQTRQTLPFPSHEKSCIFHRMPPLWTLYSVALTLSSSTLCPFLDKYLLHNTSATSVIFDTLLTIKLPRSSQPLLYNQNSQPLL